MRTDLAIIVIAILLGATVGTFLGIQHSISTTAKKTTITEYNISTTIYSTTTTINFSQIVECVDKGLPNGTDLIIENANGSAIAGQMGSPPSSASYQYNNCTGWSTPVFPPNNYDPSIIEDAIQACKKNFISNNGTGLQPCPIILNCENES